MREIIRRREFEAGLWLLCIAPRCRARGRGPARYESPRTSAPVPRAECGLCCNFLFKSDLCRAHDAFAQLVGGAVVCVLTCVLMCKVHVQVPVNVQGGAGMRAGRGAGCGGRWRCEEVVSIVSLRGCATLKRPRPLL